MQVRVPEYGLESTFSSGALIYIVSPTRTGIIYIEDKYLKNVQQLVLTIHGI
jgi:hypothetical protein